MSLDLTLRFGSDQPRRFEMINGAGGRRHWSVDDKARIIAETLEPNAIISEVPAGMVSDRSRSSPGVAKRANWSFRCSKILPPSCRRFVVVPEAVARRPTEAAETARHPPARSSLRSTEWVLRLPRQADGPDQTDLLGRHRRLPLCQASGGWRGPLAEGASRRDAADGSAVVDWRRPDWGAPPARVG